jgi:uncharacterized DUF497 family protein
MRYSYDPDKRVKNLAKHGLDFADARTVIESGPTVTFEDRRFAYAENRYITLGLLRGQVVLLVTAEEDDEVRVISMRPATVDEQTIYFEQR